MPLASTQNVALKKITERIVSEAYYLVTINKCS